MSTNFTEYNAALNATALRHMNRRSPVDVVALEKISIFGLEYLFYLQSKRRLVTSILKQRVSSKHP
jgi:hypothetical protein